MGPPGTHGSPLARKPALSGRLVVHDVHGDALERDPRAARREAEVQDRRRLDLRERRGEPAGGVRVMDGQDHADDAVSRRRAGRRRPWRAPP